MQVDGVFILAAGYGTRLRPLTHIRPKPCIPVLGASPLERWAKILRPLRPKMTVLNTHHLPEMVQIEWERVVPKGWRYCFSHEPEILDTGGGIREALPRIPGGGPVLVLNGDVLARPPLEALLHSHQQSKALCTAWVNPEFGPKTVTWDKHHNVTAFSDRVKGKAVFCGVYVLEREILGYLPEIGPFPIITALELAMRERKVRVLPENSPYWCDIGTVEMYWKLHTTPALRKRWALPGSKFPRGCLAECKNLVVENGSHLKNALLWDNVRIESGAALENVIVTDGTSVTGNHQREIVTSSGIHPLLG